MAAETSCWCRVRPKSGEPEPELARGAGSPAPERPVAADGEHEAGVTAAAAGEGREPLGASDLRRRQGHRGVARRAAVAELAETVLSPGVQTAVRLQGGAEVVADGDRRPVGVGADLGRVQPSGLVAEAELPVVVGAPRPERAVVLEREGVVVDCVGFALQYAAGVAHAVAAGHGAPVRVVARTLRGATLLLIVSPRPSWPALLSPQVHRVPPVSDRRRVPAVPVRARRHALPVRVIAHLRRDAHPVRVAELAAAVVAPGPQGAIGPDPGGAGQADVHPGPARGRAHLLRAAAVGRVPEAHLPVSGWIRRPAKAGSSFVTAMLWYAPQAMSFQMVAVSPPAREKGGPSSRAAGRSARYVVAPAPE